MALYKIVSHVVLNGHVFNMKTCFQLHFLICAVLQWTVCTAKKHDDSLFSGTLDIDISADFVGEKYMFIALDLYLYSRAQILLRQLS